MKTFLPTGHWSWQTVYYVVRVVVVQDEVLAGKNNTNADEQCGKNRFASL
jgi:hypothetical protein